MNRSGENERSRSVKDVLADLPINDAREDLLCMAQKAAALGKMIDRHGTPLAVAVQGDWGSGKTSFMRLLENQLCFDLNVPYGKNSHSAAKGTYRYLPVKIGMWRYALYDDPRQIVLRFVQDVTQSIIKVIEEGQKNLNLGLSDELIRKVSNFIADGNLLGNAAADLLLLQSGVPSFNFVKGLAASFASLMKKDDNAEKSEAVKPVRKSPIEAYQEFSQTIAEVLESCQGKAKGLMIFVDDLDRLPSKVALGVLEFLKNFLEIKGSVFVVALDVKRLTEDLGDHIPGGGGAFFDKVFQVNYRLGLRGDDGNALISALIKETALFSTKELQQDSEQAQGRSPESSLALHRTGPGLIGTVQLFLESCATNPRSLKKVFNRVLLCLASLKQKGKTYCLSVRQRTLMLGLCVLQCEFPAVYDLLRRQPEIGGWDKYCESVDFILKADIDHRVKERVLQDLVKEGLPELDGERNHTEDDEQITAWVATLYDLTIAQGESVARLRAVFRLLRRLLVYIGDEDYSLPFKQMTGFIDYGIGALQGDDPSSRDLGESAHDRL